LILKYFDFQSITLKNNLSTVFFHNLSVQSVNNNLEQQAQAIFANRFLSLATLFTIDSPLNFT